MIKLYKGKALKGDYDLAGSSFEQSTENALSLTLALTNQQKTIITFLAGEEAEVPTCPSPSPLISLDEQAHCCSELRNLSQKCLLPRKWLQDPSGYRMVLSEASRVPRI
jgi:hypothetical protein